MITGVIQKILDLIPFKLRSKIKDIPLLKQIQHIIVKRFLVNTEFVAKITGGPAKGLIFPVKLPQDKLMWIGTWELDFANALQEVVRPGTVCYDIGGYKGYYAGIMALKGASQVYVFEPVPSNAKKINKLIALNPTLPIYLKQYAVSDQEGTAVFKLMSEETMGKLSDSQFQSDIKSRDELKVNCISIDRLIEQGLTPPHFIKIDVEGAEELVLKGAKNTLLKYKPLLMIEIHSRDIGKVCMSLLKDFYSDIRVMETGNAPGNGEAEICHYFAGGQY
jgi:FkbM family methyltransferase